VLRRQRRWAARAGLVADNRGFLEGVDANLRRPLSAVARADFASGGRSELRPRGSRPAKMQALHSSAALVANVFDHWSDRDARPLLDALGIAAGLRDERPIRFEAQFPTGLRGNSPNLDVALWLDTGRVVGIESKFTEWLTPKPAGRPAFKDKYFEDDASLWRDRGLPACQWLAVDLQCGAERFRYLDAAQLLKHGLGLATQMQQQFALGYVYYDVPGAAGSAHRAEVERFAERVGAELGFRVWSYQALYAGLAATGGVDASYLAYLAARYFPLLDAEQADAGSGPAR